MKILRIFIIVILSFITLRAYPPLNRDRSRVTQEDVRNASSLVIEDPVELALLAQATNRLQTAWLMRGILDNRHKEQEIGVLFATACLFGLKRTDKDYDHFSLVMRDAKSCEKRLASDLKLYRELYRELEKLDSTYTREGQVVPKPEKWF